ncbi:TraR/DksA C4-type zinc finger protein [Aminithiophilus ramosus]|uniref:TraR/DksA C4-type zinc finger protein n=2 Tax=Synergistales TaxID=649776 RepID=A0A9Q7AD86_9BACT|nr:FmdE family protein [Aminithiophilus ramosus]QTX32234.1 TraR/DksA C4-type zinc finger protein [Aminithiophilus ramosus]QVL36102.1 TraR/DksA C4-type zinc finger protein [Synergistota bacterium]
MGTEFSPKRIEEVVAFHGHWCPGLALGIRIAEKALQEVGRAGDEEIVAVAESDSCAVDAVQVLTGCTLGKGNLVVRDVGKMAFSFYRRRDGKAVRLVPRPRPDEGGDLYRMLQIKSNEGTLSEKERLDFATLREARAQALLDADLEALLLVGPVRRDVPPHAPMEPSRLCERCGEKVMETKARLHGGRVLCPDCFDGEVRR